MSNTNSHRGQQGITIIELMITTSIFSVVLLVITAGVLQFSKQYYKGSVANSTQGAARTLIDDLTRAIQFNGGNVSPLPGLPGKPLSGGYCIGSGKRYSFHLNRQVMDSMPFAGHQGYHGLVSDTVTGCNSSTAPYDVTNLEPNLTASSLGLSNPRELLGQHMRLTKLSIVPNGDIYTINVRVVYGDDDVLCSPSTANDCSTPSSNTGVNDNKSDLTCRGSIGSSYCAVSELTTTVMKRVN